MNRKTYIVLMIVSAVVAVLSLAMVLWTHMSESAYESLVTASMGLQLAYIVSSPLLVECIAFAGMITLVHLGHLRLGKTQRIVSLMLGCVLTLFVVAGSLVAAYLPSALQIVVVVCVLIAAQYPLCMIVPALMLGFGLALPKERAEA